MTSTLTAAAKASAAQTTTDRRDKIGRTILGICALGALAATAATVGVVSDAEGATEVAETWRLAGLPVFAGIFIILARSPRSIAGLWELAIANKLMLVIAGATFLSGSEGASDFVYVDGTLVALLVSAYVLTRGWTAWSTR